MADFKDTAEVKAGTGNEPVIVEEPPTSLAATLADKAGLTLIGFPSAKSITIHTHPGRVQ
jgi:formate dehydrogenase assembly factor FdhD